VDTVEPQGQSEVVRGIVGSRERTQVSPVESYMRIPVCSSSSEVVDVIGSYLKLFAC
jgi:hypothetical protein